jgi:hypothetical protein
MGKTGLLAAVIALLVPGHGIADTLLALSCDGTAERRLNKLDPDPQTEPIAGWGLVLNFSNRTVLGFDPLTGGALQITSVDDVSVGFGGDLIDGTTSVFGTIDRVTGSVSATVTTKSFDTKQVLSMTFYELQCRPKRRLF